MFNILVVEDDKNLRKLNREERTTHNDSIS